MLEYHRRIGGTMVSNSVGVSTLKSTINPSQSSSRSSMNSLQKLKTFDKLKFYWDSDEVGKPTALFRLNIEDRIIDPEFDSNNSNQYLDSVLYDPDTVSWPISGIAISSSSSVLNPSKGVKSNQSKITTSNVKLLIIAQVVKMAKKTVPSVLASLLPTDKSLDFENLASAIFIVDNPYDPPNLWQYKHFMIPKSKLGQFEWIAAAESSGMKSYGDNDDYIYILGSFQGLPSSEQDLNSNNVNFDVFQVTTTDAYQIMSRLKVSDILSNNWNAFELLCEDIQTNSTTWVQITLINKILDSTVPLSVRLHKLFSPKITEASFIYNKKLKLWQVLTLQVFSLKIEQCSSKSIEGPWTCEYIMAIDQKHNNVKKYSTYAAKYHPEFNSEDDDDDGIVVTYVANVVNNGMHLYFEQEYYDAYLPKFHYISKIK